MRSIIIHYGIPDETMNGIMMLYKNTRSMVRSPAGYPFLQDNNRYATRSHNCTLFIYHLPLLCTEQFTKGY